jgi:hypothetical protein
LALFGMDGEQVREASWAAQYTVGLSAYIYGTGYSIETFKQEVDAIVEHIAQSAQ